MAYLIEVKDLKKNYVNEKVVTEALKGVSFTIKAGEFVAIMGPSGSGKSTLLHMLGFLDQPSGGSYKYKGRKLTDFTEEEMSWLRNQEVGFVFQMFNLLRRTSVKDNVRLPLLYAEIKNGEQETRVAQAIEMVGLSHRIDHWPSQLSGGEQQRVAIARALINKPAIIFADEPTGNLDSVSAKQIMDVITQLNKDGHTIILITHEPFIAKYAHRTIKLKDGLLVSDTKNGKRKSKRSKS